MSETHSPDTPASPPGGASDTEQGQPQPSSLDRFWAPEEQACKQRIVEFAQEELAGDDLPDRDREGSFSRDHWNRCARYGIQGLCTPETYGGTGGDIVRAVLAMEGLGRGCRDNGLTRHNAPPEASITSHEDGDVV